MAVINMSADIAPAHVLVPLAERGASPCERELPRQSAASNQTRRIALLRCATRVQRCHGFSHEYNEVCATGRREFPVDQPPAAPPGNAIYRLVQPDRAAIGARSLVEGLGMVRRPRPERGEADAVPQH